MSIFPTSPLVRRVQGLIVDTFDVSPEQAHDIAAEMVSLAEGWGSPESAAQLDWSYRIKKDLGQKLRWKSEAERTAAPLLRSASGGNSRVPRVLHRGRRRRPLTSGVRMMRAAFLLFVCLLLVSCAQRAITIGFNELVENLPLFASGVGY